MNMTNQTPQNNTNNPQEQRESLSTDRRRDDESQLNKVTNLNYVGGTVPGSMESVPPFVDEAEDRLDYLRREGGDEEEGYVSPPLPNEE